MNEINFGTGLVTYSINGKCEVSFNPTDSAFVEKLYDTFNELDKKQDKYKAEVEAAGKSAEIFDIARKRDAEMRSIIDELFKTPVCDALFGDMNVYAMCDGLPAWCNFLFAIMDEIDGGLNREQRRTNSRIAKYTAKYHK
jgi:hypothetical protein